MNFTNHHPAARRALALGVAACSWLVLSAFTTSVDPSLQAGGALATAPDTRLVAQADPAQVSSSAQASSSAEASSSAPAAEPAMSPVSYSNAQADRGEGQFTKHCVECHGDDLKGGLLGGPPLRGLAFEGKYAYEGAPAGALFEVMSTTMPPDSPGRYSLDTYADLMAYVLSKNGFQAGAELPSDLDKLYTLSMEK